MEWRSVQELRPRVSTSAGQSSAVIVSSGAVGFDAAVGVFIVLAWAAHAEKALLEVHERQLYHSVSFKCKDMDREDHSMNIRLSIGSQNDAGRHGRRFRGCRCCRLGRPVSLRVLRSFSHLAKSQCQLLRRMVHGRKFRRVWKLLETRCCKLLTSAPRLLGPGHRDD